MVGPPKNLSDLRRVEGALRVTCRACGRSETHDREVLLKECRFHQRPTDWESLKHGFLCSCGARDSNLLVLPFSENAPELRRRRAQMILINLALTVLKDAATRSTSQAVGTTEVRLALRVLHPFVQNVSLLQKYWEAATVEPRHPWTSCHNQFNWIVLRLIARGYPVNAELR